MRPILGPGGYLHKAGVIVFALSWLGFAFGLPGWLVWLAMFGSFWIVYECALAPEDSSERRSNIRWGALFTITIGLIAPGHGGASWLSFLILLAISAAVASVGSAVIRSVTKRQSRRM